MAKLTFCVFLVLLCSTLVAKAASRATTTEDSETANTITTGEIPETVSKTETAETPAAVTDSETTETPETVTETTTTETNETVTETNATKTPKTKTTKTPKTKTTKTPKTTTIKTPKIKTTKTPKIKTTKAPKIKNETSSPTQNLGTGIGELFGMFKAPAIDLLKGVLQNFDITIDSNGGVDWMQVALKAVDLYQQNITGVVQDCFTKHAVSIVDFPQRLLNNPKKCIFEPYHNLTDSTNATLVDAMKVYTDILGFVADVKDSNMFFAALKLAISENKNLVDMNDRIVRATNSTFSLILVPACLLEQIDGLYSDVSSQLNQTLCCIKAELEKSDCGDEPSEEKSR